VMTPFAAPVTVPGRLSRFQIINQSTKALVKELVGGEVIDWQAVATGFNILAPKALDSGPISSVVYGINNSEFSVVNTEPYYMCIGACTFEGLISLSALPFGLQNATGLPGETSNATFTIVPKPLLSTTVLINCGGKAYTDTQLRKWSPDIYFLAGKSFNNGIQAIENTIEDTIYYTERNNNFKYEIPVPPGEYEIKLHFAEVSGHA
jgi:Malectin domain